MIRKATLLPVEAKEVEWIRYTGDNIEEIKQFINRNKQDWSPKEKLYISDEDKEIYWPSHGLIGIGDFVVVGMAGHKFANFDGWAIVSWKVFPTSEPLPAIVSSKITISLLVLIAIFK